MLDPVTLLTAVGPWAYALLFLVVVADAFPLVGALAPGYVALIAAGFVSRAGSLEAPFVLAVGFAAAFLGDVLAFVLVRRWGPSLLARLPASARARTAAAQASLDRHLGKMLVLGRFSSPTRAIATPAAALAGVATARFAGWSAFGTGVWTVKAVGIGWLIGLGSTPMTDAIGWIGLAIAALAVFVVVRSFTRSTTAVTP